MSSRWVLYGNAALGSTVVAIGAWLAWNALSAVGVLLAASVAGLFLWWRGKTIRLIWAWSTLILGVECFVWPLMTMMRIRASTAQPSEEQMGTILSAVLMGLFSAVFWVAFSYGLFKGAGSQPAAPAQPMQQGRPPKKR